MLFTKHCSFVMCFILHGFGCLSFSEHINNVFVKAKQRISLLLRSFLSKDLMLLTKPFTVHRLLIQKMLE